MTGQLSLVASIAWDDDISSWGLQFGKFPTLHLKKNTVFTDRQKKHEFIRAYSKNIPQKTGRIEIHYPPN